MMKESIFEVEHRPGEEFVFHLRAPSMKLFPEASRGHIKTAERELLLSLRSFIDASIERLEQAEKRRKGEAEKIEVQ
jgi:hypothetical protein